MGTQCKWVHRRTEHRSLGTRSYQSKRTLDLSESVFYSHKSADGVGWWPDEDKKGHLSLIKRATSYEGLKGQRASVLFMSSPYCPAFIALNQHLHYINHINSYLSQHTYNTGYWKYLHIQTNALEIRNLQTVNNIETLHYFYESLELHFDLHAT